MCSAAWSFHQGGYQLAFNRDEKWSRPASLPPSLETTHPVPGICSRDPQAGGTWLFTNTKGITLALLNAYPGDQIPTSGKKTRGEIPLLAALTNDTKTLEKILMENSWQDYSPFHLLLLADGHLSIFTWNGKNFTADPLPPEPYFTSSSVRPTETRAARTTRFREIQHLPLEEILSDTANSDPASNIRPNRPDGGTVSRILINLTTRELSFTYTSHDFPTTILTSPVS